MRGLLLKDLYMASRYCRSFLVILIVFLGISLVEKDNLFFSFYPAVLAGILPMTLLSYDERENWSRYCDTLPVTRKQMVCCKYWIGLIFWGFVFLLALAAAGGRMALAGGFSPGELWMSAAVQPIGLIGPGLLLPLVFRFGVEKGRILFYVLIGILCAAVTLLTGMGFTWTSSVPAFPVFLALFFLSLALYLGSCLLSIQLYQKREL